MKQTNFGKVYFKEICFGVVAFLTWGCMTAAFSLEPSLGIDILCLLLGYFALSIGSYIIAHSANKAQVQHLRLESFVSSVILFATTIRLIIQIYPNDVMKQEHSLLAFALCLGYLLFNEMSLQTRLRHLKDDAQTEDNGYQTSLSKQPQEEKTEQPNDKEQKNGVKQPRRLSEDEELAMFAYSDKSDQLSTYIEFFPLCAKAEEKLFQRPYNNELLEKYLTKWELREENQLKLFDLPDAKQKLLKYIEQHQLAVKAQLKMLEQPYALELLDIYAEKYDVHQAVEFKFFEMPHSEDFVKVFLKHQVFSSEYTEIKMFDLNCVGEIILDYIKNYRLYEESELRLLAMPNVRDILLVILEDADLDDFSNEFVSQMVDMIIKLKDCELMKLYLELGKELTEEQEVKLFDFPNAAELVELYIKDYYLSEDAEVRLFELPNGKDILLEIAEDNYLHDATIDKAFELKEAEFMKGYLELGKELTEEQEVKLFDFPNAAELVELYIKENALCEDAEVRLFELPHADEIIRQYEEEHGLSLMAQYRLKGIDVSSEDLGNHDELSTDEQMKLFNLPNAKDLVMIYHDKFGLSDEAEALALAKGWI